MPEEPAYRRLRIDGCPGRAIRRGWPGLEVQRGGVHKRCHLHRRTPMPPRDERLDDFPGPTGRPS